MQTSICIHISRDEVIIYSTKFHILSFSINNLIATRKRIVWKHRLNRNLYVMLKFTERPKATAITSKKTWLPLKGTSCLQVTFVLLWMKQTLIWFNLQRDGTGNGLSNTKDTFAESLQLQISVLHQSMCILKAGLSSSYDG